MNPSTITRGLRSGLGPPTHDIGLEIQHDHILGLYQFDEKDTRYTIHFKVKEMLLHKSELGSKKSQNILTILFTEVPQISAKGNLLNQVSTGLANMLGRLVTIESIYQLIRGSIPGLFIRNNDLQLCLPSVLYSDWRGWLLALILGAGFKFRLIPFESKLNLEIYWESFRVPPKLSKPHVHPLEMLEKKTTSKKDITKG